MDKNTSRTVIVVVIAVIFVVLVLAWFTRWRITKAITCDDGKRQTIDMGDFETKYWAYSVEVEATIRGGAKVAGKISPTSLQQLSESMQSANEYRKTLVASYNSCAITRARFEQFATRYQVLDNLGHQIASAAANETLDDASKKQLQELVDQYIQTANQLGAVQ